MSEDQPATSGSRPLPLARDTNMPASFLSPGERRFWRGVQTVVWLVGVAMVVACLVTPEIGLHAVWDVLIPVAPALLVLAPGVWRNVCPMGTTALLPRRLGLSLGAPISLPWQGRLAAIGVVLLSLIVPLRHVVFDLSGPATAIALLSLAGIALVAGVLAQGKSGWCSGICPVHPVEKLYGQSPLFAPKNAHCDSCTRCVRPCPEATPGSHPRSAKGSFSRTLAGTVLIGGFSGYIFGWYMVPDYAISEGLAHLGEAFALPFAGMATTLLVFVTLRAALGQRHEQMLGRVFAAAAIICYYWFRIPALVGFGVFAGDGMLVDLSATLPEWFPIASRLVTTTAFFYLLVWRHRAPRTWTVRSPFAEGSAPELNSVSQEPRAPLVLSR